MLESTESRLMTLQSQSSAIDAYFHAQTNTLIIYLDDDCAVIAMNTVAEKLIGADYLGSDMHALCGLAPGAIAALSDQSADKTLVNLRLNSDAPRTHYFVFNKIDTGYICFGEEDLEEYEQLQRQVLSANASVNNLMREVAVKNQELAKLNVLKNQFLGMAAHDLRNPIGIVSGYADYLLDCASDNLTDQQLSVIKDVKQASEMMLGILNTFLDLARIEAGKFELNILELDIAKAIKANVKRNTIFAEQKQITLNLDVQQSLPLVSADPNSIDQILNNLISNAIKFSDPNTKVTVAAFEVEAHNQIIFSVRDRGPGLSDADKDALFKAFATAAARPTSGERSTGLGLAIVQKLVLAHGGKVWIESKLGQGSTFFVALPITANEQVERSE